MLALMANIAISGFVSGRAGALIAGFRVTESGLPLTPIEGSAQACPGRRKSKNPGFRGCDRVSGM